MPQEKRTIKEYHVFVDMGISYPLPPVNRQSIYEYIPYTEKTTVREERAVK
jgi:hypothetical protein